MDAPLAAENIVAQTTNQPSSATCNEASATAAAPARRGRNFNKNHQVGSPANNLTTGTAKTTTTRKRHGAGKPNQATKPFKAPNNSLTNKSDLIQKLTDSDVSGSKATSGNGGGGGSRKQNLNHLLNFTYESSRNSHDNYYEYERLGRQFWSTKLAKNSFFSKEQFLQANCRFVVKSGHDYSLHMSDPDRLVDWDKIEEVHVDTHSSITCPICLYEPIAGKMTKCGHVYCWSCILHYLSLSDKPWRKCPICFESIYKSDLKSVRVFKYAREYRVGDDIDLALVFRPRSLRHATLCLPAPALDHFISQTHHTPPPLLLTYDLFDDESSASYLKIHARSPHHILEQVVNRERQQLERQLEADAQQPEVCFVSEALNLLAQREEIIRAEMATAASKRSRDFSSLGQEDPKQPEIKCMIEKPSIRYVDAFDEEVFETNEEEEQQQQTPPKEAEPSPKSNNEPQPSVEIKPLDVSFFYQSSDGQRIFISGLNNRCLLSEFGTLSRAPAHLKARIVACESHFMSEENRRTRFKYLSHLPLHSEFKIVEIDLAASTPSCVSGKTLEAFRDELDERRRTRERKQARERRENERLAAAAAEREAAVAIAPHYFVKSAMDDVRPSAAISVAGALDYMNEFPEASSSPPFSSGASLVSDNTSTVSGTASSSSASATSAHSDPALVAQVSFAAMLKHEPQSDPFLTTCKRGNTTTTASTNAWPVLEQLTSSVTTMSLGGWVSMAKQQQQQMSMSGRAKRCQNAPVPGEADELGASDEHEERESMPAPSYKQSFFSAIDESLRLIESRKEVTEEGKGVATASKKKKKTKQLLFSTSLNRGF